MAAVHAHPRGEHPTEGAHVHPHDDARSAPVPRWVPVGLGFLALAGTLYTGIQDPNGSDPFPLCPLKAVTGLDCPACGCLRAVHSLARGDLVSAFDHNMLFVVAVPFLVAAYAVWTARSFGLPVPRIRVPSWLFPALVVTAVVFGVVRNLPIPGHALLDSNA